MLDRLAHASYLFRGHPREGTLHCHSPLACAMHPHLPASVLLSHLVCSLRARGCVCVWLRVAVCVHVRMCSFACLSPLRSIGNALAVPYLAVAHTQAKVPRLQ